MEVESEPGSGSTFEVRFKLGYKHFNDDDDVIILEEPSEIKIPVIISNETDNPEKVSNENQPLLLVVEDNVELRNFLTSVLSKKYRLLMLRWPSAWHPIGNLLPDFVITDLMMPVMDGLELTRKIKNDEKTCHIPVIILTAKSDLEAKVEGMHAGVDDYITKPFSAAYLEARVDNIFTQRNTLQEKYRQDIFGTKSDNYKLPDNIQSSGFCFS